MPGYGWSQSASFTTSQFIPPPREARIYFNVLNTDRILKICGNDRTIKVTITNPPVS